MNYEDQRAQPRFENLTMQDDPNISNIYRIMLISFITDVPWIMIRKIIQSTIESFYYCFAIIRNSQRLTFFKIVQQFISGEFLLSESSLFVATITFSPAICRGSISINRTQANSFETITLFLIFANG